MSGSSDDEAARARRRALVFGEVLPESPDRPGGTDHPEDVEAGSPLEKADESWLQANVPPHHGA